jgi:exo-1,4-beta-D-glucosaminidase
MKIFRLLIPFFLFAVAAAQPSFQPGTALTLPLREGWTLQSSSKVTATGEAVSGTAFKADDWIRADVPTTVVAAQVKDGLLPDPFFGMNLRQFPGVTYPIGANFSNIPMRSDSPYAVSWWYRKEFSLPNGFDGKTVWLNFRGINYRANIFLNGKQVANSNEVAGAWRTFEFNVTSAVKQGANVLAVQVWAPTENSLAITFVDWNPAPPDKNMGLWREVYLTTSGPVALRHPAVFSKVDSPTNSAAHLTVTALLKNASGNPLK